MEKIKCYGNKFYGCSLTLEAIRSGKLTWADIRSAFQMILCNGIVAQDPDAWEDQANVWPEDEETGLDYYPDVYQYYIVDDTLAGFLLNHSEVLPGTLYYNSALDLWVVGITFLGLSWTLVSTGIAIETE